VRKGRRKRDEEEEEERGREGNKYTLVMSFFLRLLLVPHIG
jgi:hypothetical protein